MSRSKVPRNVNLTLWKSGMFEVDPTFGFGPKVETEHSVVPYIFTWWTWVTCLKMLSKGHFLPGTWTTESHAPLRLCSFSATFSIFMVGNEVPGWLMKYCHWRSLSKSLCKSKSMHWPISSLNEGIQFGGNFLNPLDMALPYLALECFKGSHQIRVHFLNVLMHGEALYSGVRGVRTPLFWRNKVFGVRFKVRGNFSEL